MTDLLPRTWRRWWLERPKWLRIGCWAVASIAALNLALGVCMLLGWHEDAAVFTA
jgi:hypothetical protein